MSELTKALVAFHGDVPKIERTKTVTVKSDKGSYKFNYAPLDSILEKVRPTLAQHGLSVSQVLSETVAGHPALRTELLHVSGETKAGTYPLPVRGGESAQQIGSLISYIRRYALVSILGLATEEDDDGNHASGNSAKTIAKEPPPKFEAPRPKEPDDEALKLAELLRDLTRQIGMSAGTAETLVPATDKLIEKHAGDKEWLKRQIKTAKTQLETLLPTPF